MVSLLRTKHSNIKITLWFFMSFLELSFCSRALVGWERFSGTFTKHFQNRWINIKFHLGINSTDLFFWGHTSNTIHSSSYLQVTLHSPTSSSSKCSNTLYLNKTFLCLQLIFPLFQVFLTVFLQFLCGAPTQLFAFLVTEKLQLILQNIYCELLWQRSLPNRRK